MPSIEHLKPPASNNQLLKLVADGEGYGKTEKGVLEMLDHYVTDSIVPGICTICLGIESSCEPDADANMCSECETETVKSILVLAGVI